MTDLVALGDAADMRSGTATTDSYRYADDYRIGCGTGYYWRRWQLQQPNRLLQLWLLLQRRLGRLIETRNHSVLTNFAYPPPTSDDDNIVTVHVPDGDALDRRRNAVGVIRRLRSFW
jgi:hypothetical protein